MGVLAHPQRPNTAPIAKMIAESLRKAGIECWLFTEWTEDEVIGKVEHTDMVVAIGGDGAMLRAARVCASHQIPVLGVNKGYLGFLAEISDPDTWEAQLQKVLRNEYWIEHRMMLYTDIIRTDGTVREIGHALNDVVLGRSVEARTVRLATYIDRHWATTYNADALIIATATGSTAYALAAGGPILPPELRNILLVPVAPHLSMERPIVLAEGSTVSVIVTADTRTQVEVTIDGTRICDIQPGDRLQVRASEHISRFVRLRERNYFYRSLLNRLEPRQSIRTAPEQTQLE
ncbi:MAG: NAD(+)/NADH kinase [Chloroflexi bacterium]|nr:MAG: NAD(+)/NADH kinase [Chloroflexota bacterium]